MFRKIIHSILNKAGYDIVRLPPRESIIPLDMDENFEDIYRKCKDYTMTSIERMYALYKAIEYIINSKIEGDIVECGVWKGGSLMLSAYTLLKIGETGRKIYLYDTYKGMSAPTDRDVILVNKYPAQKVWEKYQDEDHNKWCYVSVEEVKTNMFSTGYPQENLIFIQGKVEDTLPKITPEKISLLRLDTDWYESTYQELLHLFPKLSKGGTIIIDDYGYWKGVREAVDDYFKEKGIKILLNRIDEIGVIGIKQ